MTSELRWEVERLRKKVEAFERGASQQALFSRLLLSPEMHALIDAVLALPKRSQAVDDALKTQRER
jgi:hypothetical protein